MPRPDPDTPPPPSPPSGETPRIHRTASVRACGFGRHCHVGARTRLAESTFGDYAYVRNDADIAHTEVGKFCSIAAHVRLNPGGHRLDGAAMHPFTYRASAYGLGPDDPAFFEARRARRVVLGHDVWIGHGAVVLPGVTLGTGAAIGAGAVVTRDVPPFAVAAGNPARVLRMRFPERVAQALLQIAWWDWSHERLHAAMTDFRTLDAEGFCNRYNRVKPDAPPAP